MANSSVMKLEGAAEVLKLLEAYPVMVQKAAERKGVREAAKRLRGYFVEGAPRVSGILRDSMRVTKYRAAKGFILYKVGLGRTKGETGVRFYYKVLEMPSARGKAMHPFFMNIWRQHSTETANTIVEETRKAVYSEAARINRRTLGLKKGR